MKGKMNEDTRIRNADKKQPFFDRQIKEFNSGMITRIKMPNTYFRENDIPNNEENSRNQDGRKNSFPSFDVLHSAFETVQKRNDEGSYI